MELVRRTPPWLRQALLLALVVAGSLVIGHSGEMPFYLKDAHMVVASGLRRWPVDYPPAALVTFLPGAFWGSAGISVGILTAGAALWLVLYRESPAAASTWVVLVALGALLSLSNHYDVYPALASTLALVAARRERWPAAWAWVAVATALKFYAAALWPLLLIAELRATGRWRWDHLAVSVAGFAATLAVPALTASWPAAVAIVAIRFRQSLNVGALLTPVTLLLPGGHFELYAMALSVVSPYATAFSDLFALGFGVAFIVLCLRLFRGQAALLPTATALLTWLVVLFKGLQPYYILWLLPFWALTQDRAALRWGYAAAALTTLRVVGLFMSTHAHMGPYLAFVAAANVSLLGAAWTLSRPSALAAQPSAPLGTPSAEPLPGG